MDRHRKRIIFRISLSTIFLCLIAGSVFWKAYYADALSAGEMESISSIKTLEILDNQPEAGRWTPKDQRASLSKIESWLKQAELYKGRLPQSDIVPPLPLDISVNQINIVTSDNHQIRIYPAAYVSVYEGYLEVQEGRGNDELPYNYENRLFTNILVFEYDNKKRYIKSGKLFDWLKYDWQEGFAKIPTSK